MTEDSSETLGLALDARLAEYAAAEQTRFEAERLLKAWAWKSELRSGFPLIACLVGGTGTGKSTLFNSLAERKISEVGTRRPCTLTALILVHEDSAAALARCPFLEGSPADSAIVVHDQPELAHLILVDSPDFDSVELSNRRIAENFFIISDLVIFITSQEKYGDLSGHQMREQARAWGKKTIFVLNKVASDTAYEDFRESLESEGEHLTLIRVERFDAPPICIPGLRDRPGFAELLGSKTCAPPWRSAREEERARLLRQTVAGLEDFEKSLEKPAMRIAAVNSEILEILAAVGSELEQRLDALVSQDLEERIKDRLSKLLRKYDILFVPRMMIRNFLRQVFGTLHGILTSAAGSEAGPSNERAIRNEDLQETLAAARLKPLDAAVAKLNREIAELLSSDPALDDLRKVAATDVSRWDQGKIRAQYEESFPGVEHLLEVEFNHLRDGLSTTDEMKLYGSYTLWALLLITVEIVIGGGFTLLDALLNTVIVPFIPKWLLNLKIVDVLRNIGMKVEHEHRKALRSILEKQADLYVREFSGMLPAEETMQRIGRLRESLAAMNTNPRSGSQKVGGDFCA